ncbi:MAG: OmpA family protein [Candidatus Kapabacteria bacterium]|nr:OmpA family protein [Candidatus Kapabacteria bacterium]
MFKYLILVILLFILSINENISQSILREPLTLETLPKWDNYIKTYAPSDSAFNVVVYLVNRQISSGRSAVARDILIKCKPLFPQYSQFFDNQIYLNEEQMLNQTPSIDIDYLYEEYIREKAPSENAFVALQRRADNFINTRNWDSAIFIFNKFKPLFPNFTERIDKIISILSAKSEGIIVRNLGTVINTDKDEWDPNPTPDGRYLYFSARDRQDSYGFTDIYVSKLENGTWQTPRNIGPPINGRNDETIDNITTDGNTLLLSGTFEGTFGNFDIYTATKTEKGWGNLEHLPYPINSVYTDEGGNLTSDGKALLFSSDRPGGIGQYVPFGTLFHGTSNGNMDIYVCLKTDSGWVGPINLGPTINTPYSERSPYLHPDGRTLYFSSEGHPGLGKLDVFKSYRLKEDSWTEWSEPVNLGKEINSILDDWGYKITVGGDSAFFAGHWRTIGYGGWDLFSITLPKFAKPDKVLTIKGKVTDNQGKPLSAKILWEDLNTGKNVGILQSDPSDGSYIIILPMGKNYGFYAEKTGYYPLSKNIDLTKERKENEIIENITLLPIEDILKKETKVSLNNIFFDFDKYTLKKESFPELDRLTKLIKENPKYKIKIEGHTDNIGSESYNIELSKKRAESVRNYIVSKGVSPKRFTLIGFGSSMPIASNDTEEGRAMNRRVVVSFID